MKALRQRQDKIKEYLEPLIKDIFYDELSDAFLDANGISFMSGIPVPMTAHDLLSTGGGGLKIIDIADNMAMVIGVDPGFRYTDDYVRFLQTFFDEKLVSVFHGKGAEAIRKQDYARSAVYYRAAMVIDEDDKNAYFGYACALREWYLSLEGDDRQELIADLKAESLLNYEFTVEIDEKFSPAWYYIGYAYLNQALYMKSRAAWKRFLSYEQDKSSDAYAEILERIDELEDPCKIEEGINKVITAHYEEGLRILEPFTRGKFSDWWPLHYYLACAYAEIGAEAEAIEGFRRVLKYAPSHYDSNVRLAALYEAAGEDELAQKYYKKSELLKEN